MTGGIVRWQGNHATGPEDLGLDYFIPGTYSSAVTMAYAMEKGLKNFYVLLAEESDSQENKELLEYMAKLEDGHMAKLSSQHGDGQPGFESARDDIAEGGFDTQDFSQRFGKQLQDIESIIHTAMMFEAQAYDMYSRLARQSNDTQLKSFYMQMAAEEQRHLDRLATELEKRLN